MTVEEIRAELKSLRKLNRCGLTNNLNTKYVPLFDELPSMEQFVMRECYIKGSSYYLCGCKLAYCERQVKRIVRSAINILFEMINQEER